MMYEESAGIAISSRNKAERKFSRFESGGDRAGGRVGFRGEGGGE